MQQSIRILENYEVHLSPILTAHSQFKSGY